MENQNKVRLLLFLALVFLDTVVAIPFIDLHIEYFDHELIYQTRVLDTEDIGKIVNETLERLSKEDPNSRITFNDKMSYDPFFREWYSPPLEQTVRLPNGTLVDYCILSFYKTKNYFGFKLPAALIVVGLNFVLAVIIYESNKFFSSPETNECEYD